VSCSESKKRGCCKPWTEPRHLPTHREGSRTGKAMTILHMCEAASVSRSGFYRRHHEPAAQDRDIDLRDEIQKIALEFPYYGRRRITAEWSVAAGRWTTSGFIASCARIICCAYTHLLKQHGITISMSRKGNPYDNAACESFMKTLKYEEVYRQEYRGMAEALASVGEFIDQIYNYKRLHSALRYVPPEEFERVQANVA
jgi:hypothetical protein